MAEYQVLVRHTVDLQLVVKETLNPLGAQLVSAEIITPDQYEEIRNPHRPVKERGTDLVGYVQNKVRQDSQHYHAFIGALKSDLSQYGDILTKLEQTRLSVASEQQPMIPQPPPPREDPGGNQLPAQDQPRDRPDVPSATYTGLTFTSSMSDEDFFKWLRSKGVNEKDCKTLSDNGISPSGFLLCDAEDFDGLTNFGKKQILKTSMEIKGQCDQQPAEEDQGSGSHTPQHPSQAEGKDERSVNDLVQRIERLETKFRGVYQKLVSEVTKKQLPVDEFYQELAMLPIAIRKEYESSIQQLLPAVKESDGQLGVVTSSVFLPFSPLFVFIDYDLLDHMIRMFGSAELKIEMVLYIEEVKIFMRETTVGDLIDHWGGCEVTDLNYGKLKAKFKDDPMTYTLERLNKFRRRFCSQVRLSEFIFCLISLESTESFFATWIIPAAIIPELSEAIQQLDKIFYEEEHIIAMFVNQKQLYPSSSQYEKFSMDVSSERPAEWLTKSLGDNYQQDELPTLRKLLLFKYMDKGERKKLQIISSASHKWKDIASLICDDTMELSVLDKIHPGDPEKCLRQIFINHFINRKPQGYTQDWKGLIELLDDGGLETLAEDIRYVLQ